MSQETLEERVTVLEQQMARLLTNVQAAAPKTDWRTTFGMFADDPGFDEILHLGRAIRQQDVQEDRDDACT